MIKHKSQSATAQLPIPVEMIERRIYLIRGHRVMIDTDLAKLYQVPTFRLSEQVKRNHQRFPEDFMFQLTKEEAELLTSQFAMSKRGRRWKKDAPHAFTEQGVGTIFRAQRERSMQVNIVAM